MAYVTTEERVDRLEAIFGQFMTELAMLNRQAKERDKAAEERNREAERRFALFQDEMRAFKDEMRAFKDEMRAFKDEMRAFKDEMGAFKNEMLEFKDEMRMFKNEMRQARKDSDKKWGDLANKMGTVIEDILAPNLRRLALEHFGFDAILAFMIRCTRRRPDRPELESEFDTLVVGRDTIILGEAKSSPSIEYANEFAEKIGTFVEFFPEYRGRRLVPVFGSYAIPDRVVDRLTALRIYAMRMGEDTMELANAAALESTPAR